MFDLIERPEIPDHLRQQCPDEAVLFFDAERLEATARRFRAGFPGLVTYAVKANPAPVVLDTLVRAGLRAFDVASPAEMAAVRAADPQAVLHYNNPVRSRGEVAQAAGYGISSASVDDPGELAKLAPLAGIEVSVRLALPVKGAAYDFGSKFGVGEVEAAELLRRVARAGFRPAITFHPGTQCEDAAAWEAYIHASARVARAAGVTLERLNVGGGFPSHRNGLSPDLEAIFDRIGRATRAAFGPAAPTLVCEPGRAMVADAFAIAARVKAVRRDGTVFLNDGVYGGLSELREIGPTDRLRVLRDGTEVTGPLRPRVLFGPTCDSVDRLPGETPLPATIAEGDYLVFSGMGAYSLATGTRFNGYGLGDPVAVRGL
ncbi:type III PLP-dependent enzyme [Pseudooceanicola nanhaiensis]|uniref:type III PLP-dependent enzyme n=1 Tax=Pseudooceanicola nanhaiensis TaxID=375761 RepID=UPI001CD342D3|nr:type III PLP-dependent enzyme [Pseudooceanicola nanhaiensis]MCA0921733.1 type III PLP-dependent enzyme [Pseudooceanicola nanhaiensis]